MDLIQAQRKYLLEKFGGLSEPKEAALALVGEVGELVLNSDFLSWKEKNDRENIIEEITDCLFFILELYVIYGIESWDEVVELYRQKLDKNYERKDHRSWIDREK